MSFAALKTRGKDIASLAAAVKAAEGNSYQEDPRMWKLTTDKKTGVGEALIRFLPPSDGAESPFVMLMSHGFKNEQNKKWFIENCPTTLGKDHPCPVCEKNSERWNTGLESEQNIVRGRSRKKSYYANILVLNDPANPDNNGKVFIFRFGYSIMKMIESKLTPEFESEKPVNIFDFWEGANFRLRASLNQARQTTYERSVWEQPSQLLPTDDAMEAIWKQQHDLYSLIAPDQFKPYAELLAQFNRVTGEGDEKAAYLEAEQAHTPPPPPVAASPAPVAPQEVADASLDIPFDGGTTTVAQQDNTSADEDALERYRKLLAGG